MICCVVILEAKSSPLTHQVTQAWLARAAVACTLQLQRDVTPSYGGGPFGVRVGSGPTDVQAGEMVFSILDSLPDAPGAIAYHDVTGADAPVAFLALSTCSTLDDVSTAISHEMCETAGDLACNLWADDGHGSEFARELCDSVESNSYPIDLLDGQPPIRVSDFALPAFFATGAAPPFNFMGIIAGSGAASPSAAFTTASGGYQIKRSSGTGEAQVTATSGSRRGALAQSGKHHWSSRAARRGVARTQ